MKRIVTMLSGGQDSTTCLFMRQAEHPAAEHYAISFDYGQRHVVELGRAKEIARIADVREHRVVRVDLGALGGALVDSSIAPAASGGLGDLPTTFVPGRNLIFLAIAAGWAGKLGADEIVVGASAIDYSGYPDCRPAFFEAAQKTIALALDGVVKPLVVAPLIDKTKADTVRIAYSLGPRCWAALARSWTCYAPCATHGGELRGCGQCPACALRAKGFAESGYGDPAMFGPPDRIRCSRTGEGTW